MVCKVLPSGRWTFVKELTLVKAVEGEVYLINVVTVSSYEFLGCYATGEPAIRHVSVVFLVVFSPMRDRMQILKTKTSKSSNSAASFESFADFGATIHAGL